MTTLLFAILSSSLIFVIFKMFPKFGIDTFQAIVFNYFTAFSCGVLLYGNQWNENSFGDGIWLYYAVACAFLFISLFIVMGISSQRNGVALTSTAVKMSMAMTMLLMILWYKESVGLMKIGGILAAFVGVVLVTASKESKSSGQSARWMLTLLFIGSGILDFLLNYVQNFELKTLSSSLFSAFGFGMAGIIGGIILIVQLIRKKIQFHWKNIIAGVILGIPNYFSIYLLIYSYSAIEWDDSTIVAINNVGIVILSAIVGFVIFKEALSKIKIIGLALSLTGILLMYLSSMN